MSESHRRLARTLLLVALSAFSTIGSLRGQTSFVLPDTVPMGEAERGLLRFEQARSAAIGRHDTTALRLMYATEFRGVTATGLVVDRDRLLGVFTRDDPTAVFVIDELTVRVLGSGRDTAMLTARLTTRRRGGEFVLASRFIHVYVWREDRWQILGAQGTALPPPG